MKITLFLLLATTFSAFSVNVHSQNAKVSFDTHTMKVAQLISTIETQTNYLFVYNKKNVDLNRKVTVKARNKAVSEILDEVFAGTGISYVMEGKNIVLTKESNIAREEVKQQNTITVKGVVTDMQGEAIIGANILQQGTTNGTITDIDGNFTLEVPTDAQLAVSYIGYKKQEVEIGDRNYIPVTLQKNDVLMDEVVVIGYGTVKKSDLTGAVSSVKTENLPIAANTSVTHMLAGQAAGVMVKQNSAQPGGGIEIYVRGAASTGAGNDPLYVIDGFPVTNKSVEPKSGNRYEYGSRNPMNSLNPNDIESIEILKDASATAIYGARAANGVILVTTKRGKSGKPIVKYNANYSIQTIAKRLEMLSAKEFMNVSNEISYQKWRMDNELYPYGGELEEDALPYKGNPYSPEEIAAAGEGTNWFGLLTRDGSINQHNVSVSAGTESTRFLASLNYYKQKGVIKNSDFQRISGRINLDQDLGKYVKAGINATYSTIFNNNVPLGEGNAENSSLLNSALHYDPLVPVKDESGNYALSPTPVSYTHLRAHET